MAKRIAKGTDDGKQLRIVVGFEPDYFQKLAGIAKKKNVPVGWLIRNLVKDALDPLPEKRVEV